jgi:hypothetical protein
MEISIIISLILVHFLADFALQTSEQAENKSTDLIQLTYHVLTYSFIWLIFAYCLYGSWELAFAFSGITFVSHWLTDWASSRIGSAYWKNGDLHNGFVVVGADQVWHYIQLLLTYDYLFDYAK